MRTRGILASLLAVLLGSASALEIDSSSRLTIVYEGGTRGVEQGLREVARVVAESLEESLGAKSDVVAASRMPEKVPGPRLFMGGSFARKVGLMPASFKGYDYAVAEKDGDLYFFGNDRGGANPDSCYSCLLPSALAAVRFLERKVGVLFLMPGKIGREIPKRASLTVPKGFLERGGVRSEYQAGRFFDVAYNLANNIYGRGTFHTYGGHTYPSACPRKTYFKDHPEYFAMNAKGERPWGISDGCQGYCISNPDFQKMVYDELLKRFDRGAEVCQLGQHDGSVVCHCEPCRAMYGTGDDWCEKFWLFHVELARRIQKDRPGKLVHIMCYGATANPPKSFKVFPDNVLIEVCRHTDEDMRKWEGYTVPHGFTYYIYNWGWYPIPGFTPKRSIAGLVEQVKRFNRYGMKGIYRCGYGELFGMEGPAYWVFNRLVGDPETDVPAALAQYYRGAFGPAASSMRQFYEDLDVPLSRVEKMNSTDAADLVEQTLRRQKARDPIVVLSTVYTPERVARMEAALKAAEATEGLSDRQRRRLRLVRVEWDYARNVGAIASLYSKFRENPSAQDFARMAELIRIRNAMIARLFPEGKMRRIKDWPEIQPFGCPPKDQFETNGRLGATLKAPLLWDVDRMLRYGIMPGVRMTPDERTAEMKRIGKTPLTGFALDGHPTDGAFFEPSADGSGFRFGCGTNRHVRVVRRVGGKDGLRPGKTYRISWLARWDHVLAEYPWHGFYFSAGNDKGVDFIEEPSGHPHAGSSEAWIRECTLLAVPDKPNYQTRFTFRFWHGNTGVAEVRDIVFEEVE